MKNLIALIVASAFTVSTAYAASKPVASPVASSKSPVVVKTTKASTVASKPAKKAPKAGAKNIMKKASTVAASK